MQKTKKDKDKAIKIIIQLIGKERVASFLNQNAGSMDILDKLLETFGQDGTGAVGGNASTSPSARSPPPRVPVGVAPNPNKHSPWGKAPAETFEQR